MFWMACYFLGLKIELPRKKKSRKNKVNCRGLYSIKSRFSVLKIKRIITFQLQVWNKIKSVYALSGAILSVGPHAVYRPGRLTIAELQLSAKAGNFKADRS